MLKVQQPTASTAAVVTCGGLSPGLNDVIRSIVMELWHGYRVTEIDGIRYGYECSEPAASNRGE